jgi:hypothetical protein
VGHQRPRSNSSARSCRRTPARRCPARRPTSGVPRRRRAPRAVREDREARVRAVPPEPVGRRARVVDHVRGLARVHAPGPRRPSDAPEDRWPPDGAEVWLGFDGSKSRDSTPSRGSCTPRSTGRRSATASRSPRGTGTCAIRSGGCRAPRSIEPSRRVRALARPADELRPAALGARGRGLDPRYGERRSSPFDTDVAQRFAPAVGRFETEFREGRHLQRRRRGGRPPRRQRPRKETDGASSSRRNTRTHHAGSTARSRRCLPMTE